MLQCSIKHIKEKIMKTINTIVAINTEALKSLKDVKAPSNPQEFVDQVSVAGNKVLENTKTVVLAAQEDQLEFLKKVQVSDVVIKQVENYFTQVNTFFNIK